MMSGTLAQLVRASVGKSVVRATYTVYILRSKRDGKFYTGYSGDLDLRLREHGAGKVKSTKNRRPLELVFEKEFETRAKACNFERYLKSPEGGPRKNELVRQYRLLLTRNER